jgi:GAF domain-containing protein
MITPGDGYEMSEGDTIFIGNTVLRLVEVPEEKVLDVTDSMIQDSQPSLNKEDRLPDERRSPSSRNVELISKVSELLRETLSINEIFEKLLEYLMDALPRVDRSAILLYDDQKGDIKEVFSKSRQGPWDEAVRYSRTIVGRVLEGGKAIRMSNTEYEAPDDFSESMSTMQIGSAMCVPVISHSVMRGAIYVDSIHVPYGFRKDDLLLLKSFSGPVAVIIENEILLLKLKGDSS